MASCIRRLLSEIKLHVYVIELWLPSAFGNVSKIKETRSQKGEAEQIRNNFVVIHDTFNKTNLEMYVHEQ